MHADPTTLREAASATEPISELTATVRRVLRRTGLSHLVSRRAWLARRYLTGDGLEIGALNNPVPLPRGARARYVDVASRQDSIRKFPALRPGDVVEVAYLTDGFSLNTVPSDRFDFVIANQLLEHAPNPIGALQQWWRVLRDCGILFCSVPIAGRGVDRGRPATSYQHMLDDWRMQAAGRRADVKERNSAHYREWVLLCEPNSSGQPPPAGAALKRRVTNLSDRQADIHFHTFTLDSVRELFTRLAGEPLPGLQILQIREAGNEVVAVVKKQRHASEAAAGAASGTRMVAAQPPPPAGGSIDSAP
jgi:SAM-dependent methyltransferase